MEKFLYNLIADEKYFSIITVLDYELSLRSCLSEFEICSSSYESKKIIVDLALKVGVNKYRFVEYDVGADGKLIWSSSSYVTPSAQLITLSNHFIRKKETVLPNSMLPKNEQTQILMI